MKKLKINHTAVMLKYSVWIADLVFTRKVFDSPEPCFVLNSNKGILCKFCTLHDLDASASVKSDQRQYGVISPSPTQKQAMTKHLESGQRKASISIKKT